MIRIMQVSYNFLPPPSQHPKERFQALCDNFSWTVSIEVPKMEPLAVFLRSKASWATHLLVFFALLPLLLLFSFFTPGSKALPSPEKLIQRFLPQPFSGNLSAENIFLPYASKNRSSYESPPKPNFNYI